MTRYGVRDLHTLLLWIDHMANFTTGQENYRQGQAVILNDGEKKSVVQQVGCLRKHFTELELADALGLCDDLEGGVGRMTLGECRGHLLGIRRVLTDALEKRVFMYVPVRVAKYARSAQCP